MCLSGALWTSWHAEKKAAKIKGRIKSVAERGTGTAEKQATVRPQSHFSAAETSGGDAP